MAVPIPLQELTLWDALSSEERHSIASEIAQSLPTPWHFVRMETHTLGGVAHEIALFDYYDNDFALIPGSQDVTLGYDPAHPWIPTPELLPDIQSTKEFIGDDFIAGSMTPLRHVGIAPFLIEVRPTQATWVDELEESDSLEAADIAATYRRDGFRLPTSDEWEYSCAAGTRTLWRWGDTIPFPESGQTKDWKEDSKPNAFGLIINSDTYWTEMCDGGELRAGDGGVSACGGYGVVVTWIPLASPYQEDDHSFRMAPTEYGEQMNIRRVWSLSG